MSTDPVFTRERGSEEHPSEHQITVRPQSSSGEPRSRIWTAHPGSTHYKQHAARSVAASAGRVMVNINIRQRHIAGGGGLRLSLSLPASLAISSSVFCSISTAVRVSCFLCIITSLRQSVSPSGRRGKEWKATFLPHDLQTDGQQTGMDGTRDREGQAKLMTRRPDD